MVCHRIMQGRAGAVDVATGAPLVSNDAAVNACIGSKCALWVPEDNNHDGAGPAPFGGSVAPKTGKGFCNDNLRATPWADPAVTS